MPEQVYEGYGPRVDSLVQQYLDSIPTPEIGNTQPSTQTGGAAVAASSGLPKFPAFVQTNETKKGSKLSPEELDSLKDQFERETVAPWAWGQKGASQGKVKASIDQFNSAYERFRAQYLQDQKEGAATTDSGEDPGQIRENVAALLGAAAQTVPGTLGLIDNLARIQGSPVTNAAQAVSLLLHGQNPLDAIRMRDRTFLGDIASGMSRGIDTLVDRNTSAETKRQRQEISDILGDDPNIGDTIQQYLEHPRALAPMISQGVGSVVPMFLGAGAASRAPKVAEFLKGLSPWQRQAVFAGAAGLPQSSTVSWEDQIQATPIEQLTQNPKFAQYYETAKAVMGEQAAADYTKRRIISEGAGTVLGANVAGNVGVSALIPGGAEAGAGRLAGGNAAAGLIRRLLTHGISEAAEEGTAGAIQTIGENVASGRDTTQGVGRSAAEGALAGFAVGGLANVRGNKPQNALKKQKKNTPAANATGGAQPSAPAQGTGDTGQSNAVPPTPNAQAGNAFANAPAQGVETDAFDKIVKTTTDSIKNLNKKTFERRYASVKKANKASDYVNIAADIAQNNAGEAWNTLDRAQRIRLVAEVVDTLQKKSPQMVEDLGPVLTAMMQLGNTATTPTPENAATTASTQPTDTTGTPQATATASTPQVTETATPAIEATQPVVQSQPTPQDLISNNPAETRANVETVVEAPEDKEKIRNRLRRKVEERTATPATVQPANTAALPRELSGARVNYGIRPVTFENDTDKALFIVSQTKKSKSDAKYRDFLKSTGLTDEQINTAATALRARVKAIATGSKGPISVPAEQTSAAARATTQESAPVQGVLPVEPAPAPVEPAPAPVEAPTQEAAATEEADGRARIDKLNNITSGRNISKEQKDRILKNYDTVATTGKGINNLRDSIRSATAEMTVGSAGIAEPIIAAAKQEYANRPKKQAPAQEEVGAVENQLPQEPETVAESQEVPATDLESRIREVIGDDVLDTDLAEVIAAARNVDGANSAQLTIALSDLVKEEYITREQARQVRTIANEEAAKEKPQTEAADDQDELDATAKQAEADELEPIEELQRIREFTPDTTEPTARTKEIKARIYKLKLDILSGRTTREANHKAIKELMHLNTMYSEHPDRGAAAVRKAIEENPNLTKAMREFTLWLLDQNPNLAKDLKIHSDPTIKEYQSGSYNAIDRIIRLAKSDVNETTIVHEILHHAERMLPPKLQQRLRDEYTGRLINKVKQVEKKGSQTEKDLMQAIVEYNAIPNPTTYEARYTLLRKLIQEKPRQGKVTEFYRYFDSSEYFAETGSEILNRKFRQPDGFVAKLREWVSEFIDRLKKIVGTNDTLKEALDHVLTTEGDFKSSSFLSPINILGLARMEELAKVAEDKVSAMQWIGETFANNAYGLEKAMQYVHNNDGIITPETNIEEANYRFNGETNYFNSEDTRQAIEPASTWVQENYTRFAGSLNEFVDKLNIFFQNKNFLERVHSNWLENVPLNNGKEFSRDNILEDMQEGSITPADARKKLETLVRQNAAMDEDTFYEQARGKHGITLESLRNKLDELEDEGIDENSMEELNTLMDRSREVIRKRHIQAGKFTDADPWVKFRNWKYYVPLKERAYKAKKDEEEDFDIPNQPLNIASLSRQMEVMQGRTSLAERPFTRLFVDVLKAGKEAATKNFNDALFGFVADNEQLLGARITRYEGSPKQGYTNEDGDEFASIPRKANEFIVNDGDEHFVITLPRDSQLLRGLQLRTRVTNINNTDNPVLKALSKVGKATNILARLYTTISPEWQAGVGFVRDLTQVPVTLGVSQFDSPLQAGHFFANYGKNVIQSYQALRNVWPALKGDMNEIHSYAEANPGSYADWLVRYEKNGGANDFTEGYDIGSMERVLAGRGVDENGLISIPKTGYNTVLKYTGNFANFTEKLARVAAFKTLVEGGMTEAEAAIKVRKTLDYSQTGTAGRAINAWLAFYRVGATNVDVMRRAFTKPGGGLDWPKAAKWGSTFAAIGYLGYMMQAALLGKDDDDKERIKKLRVSTLTQKLVIPFGDKTIGLNIGLGLPQAMLAPGVIAAALENGHISYDDAAKELYEVFNRNITPIRPAGMREGSGVTGFVNSWLQSVAPTPLAPIRDIAANTDPFGRPIHQVEGYINPNLSKSENARSSTPQEFTDIARFFKKTFGYDMYPEDYRYLATNYGGQLASTLIKELVNRKNQENAGVEPSPVRLAGKFLVEDEKYYYENTMYDTLDKLREYKQRYEDTKKESGEAAAQKLLSTDKELSTRLRAFESLDKARKARDKQVKELRNNKLLSPERKRLLRKRIDSELRKKVDDSRKLV